MSGREIGRKFGSFLLVTLLGLVIALSAVVELTTREGVGELAKPVIEEQLANSIGRDELNSAVKLLKDRCTDTRFPTADLPFQNSIVSLDCETLKSVQGENFISAFINSFIDGFYYKEYGCDIISCLRSGDFSNYFVLASEQGHQAYKAWFWTTLVFVIIGGAMVLYFADSWIQRTFMFGVAFFGAGAGFVVFKLINFFSKKEIGNQMFEHLIAVFNSEIELKLIIAFVIGVALLAASVVMKKWQMLQDKRTEEQKRQAELTKEQQWAEYYREHY